MVRCSFLKSWLSRLYLNVLIQKRHQKANPIQLFQDWHPCSGLLNSPYCLLAHAIWFWCTVGLHTIEQQTNFLEFSLSLSLYLCSVWLSVSLSKCEHKLLWNSTFLLIGSSWYGKSQWKTLSLTSSQMVPRFGNSKEQWWPFSKASVIVRMSYRTFHSIKWQYKQITSREVWLVTQMDPSFHAVHWDRNPARSTGVGESHMPDAPHWLKDKGEQRGKLFMGKV